VGLAAILSGFNKTGIKGIGILAVVLMASAVPSKRLSVGMLLPMLIVADLFAIWLYRRHASWVHLRRLFPWSAAGLACGLAALGLIRGERLFGWLLGGIALAMLALHAARAVQRGGLLDQVPRTRWFTAGSGLLAGFATGFGNAAGPVMSAYVLSLGLDKRQFMGTTAWFFFAVNLIKVPVVAAYGLITAETLTFNALMAPLIVVGALAGPFVLKAVPQRGFEWVVFALAVAGALRLLLW